MTCLPPCICHVARKSSPAPVAFLHLRQVLDNALFAHAESVSNRFFGKDVYYRGIVEFSNVRPGQGHAVVLPGGQAAAALVSGHGAVAVWCACDNWQPHLACRPAGHPPCSLAPSPRPPPGVRERLRLLRHPQAPAAGAALHHASGGGGGGGGVGLQAPHGHAHAAVGGAQHAPAHGVPGGCGGWLVGRVAVATDWRGAAGCWLLQGCPTCRECLVPNHGPPAARILGAGQVGEGAHHCAGPGGASGEPRGAAPR